MCEKYLYYDSLKDETFLHWEILLFDICNFYRGWCLKNIILLKLLRLVSLSQKFFRYSIHLRFN